MEPERKKAESGRKKKKKERERQEAEICCREQDKTCRLLMSPQASVMTVQVLGVSLRGTSQ